MIDLEDNRKLILEDGEEYVGSAFGYTGEKVLELLFNTSMVGYQEILSDPSCTDQAVIMTYGRQTVHQPWKKSHTGSSKSNPRNKRKRLGCG